MVHVTPLRAVRSVLIATNKETKKPTSCTKINHTARFQGKPGIDGAKALASIKKRRKRYKHSRQLELCIRNTAITRKFIRPLKKYLIQKIRQGYTYPTLPNGLLLAGIDSISYSA